MKYTSVNLYFEDESRFGLFTRNGKSLTAMGVKPICPFQQVFQSTYLFGAFSPITGDRLLLEMPTCNADNFQLFLEELSILNPDEFKIVVLDNGPFHKAARLVIPSNIALMFLPPYSPELNPAEKIWWKMKRAFSNKIHRSLDELSDFISEAIKILTPEQVKKTCGFEYVFSYLNWYI